jgi:hypothetical protein
MSTLRRVPELFWAVTCAAALTPNTIGTSVENNIVLLVSTRECKKVDLISLYILCLPSRQVIVIIDEATCMPCRYTQSL